VRSLRQGIEEMKMRFESLTSLRRLVALPPGKDITARQWGILAAALGGAQTRLIARVNRAARAHLASVWDPSVARQLNAILGEVELETARAFTFFDTYMDVLTQRHSPELGSLLAGCDVIAWDALYRKHPALSIVEPPIVLCD